MSTVEAVEYFIGDELEPLTLWWYANSSLVDFSVAHTYTLKVASTATPTTTVFTKSTGIQGTAGSGTKKSGSPNLTISWANSGELNSIPSEGRYICEITATRTSDSLQRTGRIYMDIKSRLT